jgi:tRNA uridine 5-carbamoylmethylation protein Kti12
LVQIARRRFCGFCQLHLAADTATASLLNRRREAAGRVEDDVIRTMATKLEPPDPLGNSWERFSFSIPVTDGSEVNFSKFINIYIPKPD